MGRDTRQTQSQPSNTVGVQVSWYSWLNRISDLLITGYKIQGWKIGLSPLVKNQVQINNKCHTIHLNVLEYLPY